MNSYLITGRAACRENDVMVIEAGSFKEAAFVAALELLAQQHESWNDDIYIDMVANKNFEYEENFVFGSSWLRSEEKEIARLSVYNGLDTMISDTQSNIQRLKVTISNTAFQKGYIENCKTSLESYQDLLVRLMVAKRRILKLS